MLLVELFTEWDFNELDNLPSYNKQSESTEHITEN